MRGERFPRRDQWNRNESGMNQEEFSFLFFFVVIGIVIVVVIVLVIVVVGIHWQLTEGEVFARGKSRSDRKV